MWPAVIGTFASVSTFGLLIAGALASETSPSHPHPRYSLNVTLSEPVTKRNDRSIAMRSRKNHPALPSSTMPQAEESGSDQQNQAHVDKALDTGELQEWLGSDGQRYFLTAGPVRIVDGRPCRDMVLLIRRADGGSQAQNSRHCATGRLKETASSLPAGQLQSTIMRDIPDTLQDGSTLASTRLSSINMAPQATIP